MMTRTSNLTPPNDYKSYPANKLLQKQTIRGRGIITTEPKMRKEWVARAQRDYPGQSA